MQYLVKHIVNGTLSQNICRICLLPLGDFYEDLFTVVCKENKEYCIADVLQEICGLKFIQSDQYRTCPRCFKSASEAYKFYLQVQHNEEILNYYVNEIKNQVDMINIPVEASADALCISLQYKTPMLEEFDYDIDNFPFKKFQKESELIDRTVKLEENRQLDKTINKKFEKKVDLDNIVMVLPESGEKKYYTSHEDGSLSRIECKDVEQLHDIWKEPLKVKSSKKGRRKRHPMAYKMCSNCPVQYKFFGKLKEHMKTMHNIDLYVCKVCKAIIEDEQEFNRHLQTHRGLYICEICNSVFKKRKTIILHLQWHEEMRRMCRDGAHICEVCGVMLLNEEQLKEHKEKKHVNKYTCYYCGRMYKVETSFEMHIKKHEMHKYCGFEKERAKPNGKPKERFTCSQCGKDLVDERALLWHSRLHAGARPYSCSVCGRAFVSRGRRNQHALCAHTPPARRCPLCPALFHLRSMVNSHIKKVHLKTHKRRSRESKHKYVCWKTEPVPIQELSVSIQNEILKLQTG